VFWLGFFVFYSDFFLCCFVLLFLLFFFGLKSTSLAGQQQTSLKNTHTYTTTALSTILPKKNVGKKLVRLASFFVLTATRQ